MMNSKETRNENLEILIVEDSQTQAGHLRYILEQQGHRVSLPRNGTVALALIHDHLSTMVIIDIVMPEMVTNFAGPSRLIPPSKSCR